MINKLPPFKGLNIRIPIIIPIKGRAFINHGSGLLKILQGDFDKLLKLLPNDRQGCHVTVNHPRFCVKRRRTCCIPCLRREASMQKLTHQIWVPGNLKP